MPPDDATLPQTALRPAAMRDLIQDTDWSATPLGARESWPASLRTVLSLCLHSGSPTAIYWGPDLRLLYNDAWAAFLVERHPWALGRAAAEVWADIWEQIGPELAAVVESGQGFSVFDQHLSVVRQGRVRDTYWTYSFTPILDEFGRVAGILNQAHEVTERVFAERRHRVLLDLSDRLRGLSAPHEIIATAQQMLGEHLKANRVGYGEVEASARYFTTTSNWTDGSVPPRHGTHDLEGFGPDVVAALREGRPLVVRDVGADPRTNSPEAIAAFAAIDTRSVITASLVKGGRMRAALYVHTRDPRDWTDADVDLVQEVAERTWSAVERAGAEAAASASEARLRLSEAKFEAIANSIDQMIWSTRPDGFHDYYNDRWYEFTGVPAGSTDGEAWSGMFHPDDQDRAWAVWRHSLETGEPYHIEYRLRHRSGQYRWVIGRAQCVRDDQGDIARWYGTCTDIHDLKSAQESLQRWNDTLEVRIADALSERQKVEEALRQSQKLESMGQLTGGVAHDFNNLLTPIIAGLDMLQRRGVGDERAQRLIDGALQSAERAKTLVQRLLAFARRQPLQAVPVDLPKLVAGMAELVSSTSGPRVKLEVNVPQDLPAVRADPNQLELAILNLAVNARDAMPEGGRLTLAAAQETIRAGGRRDLPPGRYVRLSVSDSGVGMDEITLARAIEPFFSTKGVGRGTGLGLSMVHGLAAQLGGVLEIRSRPGVGTSVELILPIAQADAAPDAETTEPAGLAATGSALLVDDEDLVRASTADMLAELGFKVLECRSAEEALALIERGPAPSIVITDHMMPGMTGAELARTLKARDPTAAVLIISGYAEDDGIAPDLPRLTKPFRQAELAAMLAELTG